MLVSPLKFSTLGPVSGFQHLASSCFDPKNIFCVYPHNSGQGSGLANALMLRCRGVCHMSAQPKPAQLCDGEGEGGNGEESSRCAVRSVLMVR